jgi:hypothetical protein
LEEGLLKEPVERKSEKDRPVADYIKERDADNEENGNPGDEELLGDSPNWESWLQKYRVELNAMTTKEFVDWMHVQFEEHEASKTIPTEELALSSVSESLEFQLSRAAKDEIEKERQADIDAIQEMQDELDAEIEEETKKRTGDRLEQITLPTGPELVEEIEDWLEDSNHSHWTESIFHVAWDLIPGDQRPPEPTDQKDGE